MRILLFSDPHYSVDSRIEEEKWFPPICTWLEKIQKKFKLQTNLVEKFLSFWDRLTQKKTELIFEEAKKHGPYDFIIGLGGYTPGTNESGMITKKSVEQFMIFKKLFHKYFPLTLSLFVWGDHDAGYKFDVSGKTGMKIGTETGGISVESVMSAKILIGMPYGTSIMNNARFIYLSTNLIRNVDKNSSDELKILAEKQMEYVIHELLEARSDYLTFLLLHDPTALKLNGQIMDAIEANGNVIIFHGHMHAGFSAFIARIFYPFYQHLCKRFETYIVPAPWGMFGIGGGFLIADLKENGFEVKKIKTPKLKS